MKLKKKLGQKKSEPAVVEDDVFDELFDEAPAEDDDPFADDLFAEINVYDPDQPKRKSVNATTAVAAAARGGHKQFNVTIEYDPLRISGYSELLMECIASRGVIKEDFGMEQALHVCKLFANHPVKVLSADEDRWQLYIFSVEYIRLHGTEEQNRDARSGLGKANPDWDEKAENVIQDGRTIGGIDLGPGIPPVIPVTGDSGVSHAIGEATTKVRPIREQMDSKQKKHVEKNAPEAKPAKLDKKMAEELNPQDRVWELAVERAKMPREDWENKVDWMLEQRIRYAYHWIQDAQTLTKPYKWHDLCLFWPTQNMTENKDARNRRDEITGKVMDFWRKSVAKNGEGIDLTSDSYRTTLYAMQLQEAINNYVSAGVKFDLQGEVQDKEEELAVRTAAKRYFEAHFPVETQGAGPGPKSTKDPNYAEYVRLCRQYGLKPGTLLHETKL